MASLAHQIIPYPLQKVRKVQEANSTVKAVANANARATAPDLGSSHRRITDTIN